MNLRVNRAISARSSRWQCGLWAFWALFAGASAEWCIFISDTLKSKNAIGIPIGLVAADLRRLVLLVLLILYAIIFLSIKITGGVGLSDKIENLVGLVTIGVGLRVERLLVLLALVVRVLAVFLLYSFEWKNTLPSNMIPLRWLIIGTYLSISILKKSFCILKAVSGWTIITGGIRLLRYLINFVGVPYVREIIGPARTSSQRVRRLNIIKCVNCQTRLLPPILNISQLSKAFLIRDLT